jgi:hypothetical protein
MSHEIRLITVAGEGSGRRVQAQCACGLKRQATGYPSLTRGLHIATQHAAVLLEVVRRFDGHLEGAEEGPAVELASSACSLERGAAELREQAAALLKRAEVLDTAVAELQALT